MTAELEDRQQKERESHLAIFLLSQIETYCKLLPKTSVRDVLGGLEQTRFQYTEAFLRGQDPKRGVRSL